jgi:hypothetical protein
MVRFEGRQIDLVEWFWSSGICTGVVEEYVLGKKMKLNQYSSGCPLKNSPVQLVYSASIVIQAVSVEFNARQDSGTETGAQILDNGVGNPESLWAESDLSRGVRLSSVSSATSALWAADPDRWVPRGRESFRRSNEFTRGVDRAISMLCALRAFAGTDAGWNCRSRGNDVTRQWSLGGRSHFNRMSTRSLPDPVPRLIPTIRFRKIQLLSLHPVICLMSGWSTAGNMFRRVNAESRPRSLRQDQRCGFGDYGECGKVTLRKEGVVPRNVRVPIKCLTQRD